MKKFKIILKNVLTNVGDCTIMNSTTKTEYKYFHDVQRI